MLIEHLGKKLNTETFDNLITDNECKEIRRKFYEKPDEFDVYKQLFELKTHRTIKMNHVYNYYFYELMADCKIKGNKWTINEFMQSNDLIRYAMGRIKDNPEFFDGNTIDNIKTFFRVSSKGAARKLSNFPLKTINSLLKEYRPENYYDFSCGWGVRMLSAIRNNVNYYGTDPNTRLTVALKEILKEYGFNNFDNIYNHGSEIFIPELENKIDFCFSSPPYFDLEQYSQNDLSGQSTADRNYDAWLKEYLKPTFENCKLYLKKDKDLLINIKSSKDYDLYQDTKDIVLDLGFEFIKEKKLENIQRPSLKDTDIDTNEKIMCFKKV